MCHRGADRIKSFTTTPRAQSRYEWTAEITGTENVFAFRAAWASPTEFYYVADGKIRKRTLGGNESQVVPFTAMMQVTRADGSYTRVKRDFTSVTPRQVLGVVKPSLSPDGKQIAFAAVGDIYLMPVGGRAVNLTKDAALDTDPAWSPDGSQLAYSSDKDSEQLQLWIRDMKTGQSRKVTNLTTQPRASSPDGRRIAFNVDGMARGADRCSRPGTCKIHDELPQPRQRGRRWQAHALGVGGPSRAGSAKAPTVLTMRRRVVMTSGSRRCRCCRSIRVVVADRRGRRTGPRWLRSTRGFSRCGRCRRRGSRSGRRVA